MNFGAESVVGVVVVACTNRIVLRRIYEMITGDDGNLPFSELFYYISWVLLYSQIYLLIANSRPSVTSVSALFSSKYDVLIKVTWLRSPKRDIKRVLLLLLLPKFDSDKTTNISPLPSPCRNSTQLLLLLYNSFHSLSHSLCTRLFQIAFELMPFMFMDVCVDNQMNIL